MHISGRSAMVLAVSAGIHEQLLLLRFVGIVHPRVQSLLNLFPTIEMWLR